MKNIIKVIFFTTVVCLFSSCISTNTATMAEKYSDFYAELPTTFVIMPPINKTTNVDAKEYFYTTLNYKICEKGFYVLPPIMTMDILRQESAYDAEHFVDRDLKIFNKTLGADVCVFTIINSWDKDAILTDSIAIGIEYVFKSTKTNAVLYRKKGSVVYSFRSSSGGLLGLLVDKLSTALTDYIKVAHDVNNYALTELPAGKYVGDVQFEATKTKTASSYDTFDVRLKK